MLMHEDPLAYCAAGTGIRQILQIALATCRFSLLHLRNGAIQGAGKVPSRAAAPGA